MILKINQTKKDERLWMFEILQKDQKLGIISINRQKENRKADIQMKFLNKEYTLKYEKESFEEKPWRSGYKSCFKYMIYNGARDDGYIYRVDEKQQLFLNSRYYEMQYNGFEYNLYPLGLDVKENKYSIYCNKVQVAQVDPESLEDLKNDFCHYMIYAINLREAKASVLLWIYMYLDSWFCENRNKKRFYEKYTSKKQDQFLWKQYHPHFIQTIEE